MKESSCWKCNQNRESDTPQHIAVRNRYVQHKVSKLLSCGKCNPDIPNTTESMKHHYTLLLE